MKKPERIFEHETRTYMPITYKEAQRQYNHWRSQAAENMRMAKPHRFISIYSGSSEMWRIKWISLKEFEKMYPMRKHG